MSGGAGGMMGMMGMGMGMNVLPGGVARGSGLEVVVAHYSSGCLLLSEAAGGAGGSAPSTKVRQEGR